MNYHWHILSNKQNQRTEYQVKSLRVDWKTSWRSGKLCRSEAYPAEVAEMCASLPCSEYEDVPLTSLQSTRDLNVILADSKNSQYHLARF